jgi:hypothetical protein
MTDDLKALIRKAAGDGEGARALRVAVDAEIAAAKRETITALNRDPSGEIQSFEALCDMLLTAAKVRHGFIQITRSMDEGQVAEDSVEFSTKFRVWLVAGDNCGDVTGDTLREAAIDACDLALVKLPDGI